MNAPARGPLIVDAALGRCPRCGTAGLFASIVRFAPRCRQCGLDFGAFNVGDGAAPFLIFIVGAIVVGLAMWLELSRSPPLWMHAVLWIPLTLGLTLALLRVAKGMLLTLEYRNAAGEGRAG